MTITKKVEKQRPIVKENDIEKVISRGGRTTAESEQDQGNNELKFTLRIPASIMAEVDRLCVQEVGHVSRNTWILRAIKNQLNKR